jgi:hypothetical protein
MMSSNFVNYSTLDSEFDKHVLSIALKKSWEV